MESAKLAKAQLKQILDEERIRAVFQPIVSLKDGSILGYEALSRIALENCSFNTEEMFSIAQTEDQLWRLEYICRQKALKAYKESCAKQKLFLNVDPYVIHDKKFREGMTRSYLDRYNISPEKIVFEITERTSIKDEETFMDSMNHYKSQDYQIAIDDFGSGYAGINRVCILYPSFIKIDMVVVRNIHMDEMKSSMVESIAHFCKSVGIRLIAEGIETMEELKKLIQLGVDYGQGYFLGKPESVPPTLPGELKDVILRENRLRLDKKYAASIYSNVGSIYHRKDPIHCEEKAVDVYEYMKKDPSVTELCVVDESQRICGLLTKRYIDECFGGRYGYTLNGRKLVQDLLDEDYLSVDSQMSIEMVTKIALMRPQKQLYDAVVISQDGKYHGIVTVKDLLEATAAIQVERATDANPLTHLPGNQLIQEEIAYRISSGQNFSVMYLDLDNFKAYNDAYGFENGDRMITAVADSMKFACRDNEFLGHVGGDDFVIISDHYHIQEVYDRIIQQFHTHLPELYSPDDYDKKQILSRNRRGEKEVFPLASLSCALLSNERINIHGIDDFSKRIALAKKESKLQPGDSLFEYK
ncbi:MAG: GGDEF domain-containing protein [Lachnospiraceae bacterium]